MTFTFHWSVPAYAKHPVSSVMTPPAKRHGTSPAVQGPTDSHLSPGIVAGVGVWLPGVTQKTAVGVIT